MKNRDFDAWLEKFRPSISGYNYYIDFEKIIEKYPETLSCIPLLLAVRGNEIYAQDAEGAFLYNFSNMNYNAEQYKIFMRKRLDKCPPQP